MTAMSTWSDDRWRAVFATLDAVSRERALTTSESLLLARAINEIKRPAYTRGAARPAIDGFPYPHRTVAEIERG